MTHWMWKTYSYMNRAVARTNAQMNSICWVITVNYISTMTSFYYGLAAILDTLYGVSEESASSYADHELEISSAASWDRIANGDRWLWC